MGEGPVLLAGGGTAGHVLPGIAVAQELVSRGHPPETVHFVGSARGPDADLVGTAGFDVALLPGRGITRDLSPANISSLWDLARSAGRAISLVRRTRPSVVLVLGGYAAFGCALAAVLWRVPMVVAEQNARAGAVNRLAGLFAKDCAVPFASTDLPRKLVVGNPVRSEIRHRGTVRDPAAAREALGLPAHGTLVAVFAGSLGARRINTAVWQAMAGRWSGRDDLVVHHVVGARDWEDRPDTPSSSGPVGGGGPFYNPVRYEDRMALLLDAADLVVCRSGGTTVAELTVMGTPSVLVPLPIATRDHQRANASELEEVGAAVVVADDSLDGERLTSVVEPLIGDPSTLEAMGRAALSIGHPDAAARIADLLERHGR